VDKWEIYMYNQKNLERDLGVGKELATGSPGDRRLVKLDNYELLSGGFCVDSAGKGYDSAIFMDAMFAMSPDSCASLCDQYVGCKGFDVGFSDCFLHFESNSAPANLPFMYETVSDLIFLGLTPGMGAFGDIVASNGLNRKDSCYFKRRNFPADTTTHLDNYSLLGNGYCNDSSGSGYSRLAFYLGYFGDKEDCAVKCDGFPLNQGLEWDRTSQLCMCLFNSEDLPFTDADSLAAIPGACTDAGMSFASDGECAIDTVAPPATGDENFECYKNSNAPSCDDDYLALKGGVNGDPLFMGLHGQVFKFEGRSGAWYSNVATKKLQWNLRFKEFETCPKDENMFVTGTTIMLYQISSPPFMEPKLAHTIEIMVVDEDKFSPGCQSEVCLGEGSLKISLDGKMDITSPGDYPLGNNGGRVIAHNTFSACSRKWFDYVVDEMDNSEDDNRRNLQRKTPLEIMNESKGEMLDPKKCTAWMKNRAHDGDLFSQEGGWSTIHIETPTISFHVEYHQDRGNCNSHSIDAWISKISPVLLKDEWQGVLGETRKPKFYPNGEQVTSERSYLLTGEDDRDYEVNGPFGKTFAAQKKSPEFSSS